MYVIFAVAGIASLAMQAWVIARCFSRSPIGLYRVSRRAIVPVRCTRCGENEAPLVLMEGSRSTAIVLYILGFLPGLIYDFRRMASKRLVCSRCKEPMMVPATTAS
jgi:hypothetical protein